MSFRANHYPYRVNARLDKRDFETVDEIALWIDPYCKATFAAVLRYLLEEWRSHRRDQRGLVQHGSHSG